MANQFTDIKIIECNRLHSEESKSNNNENLALWKNNLQDILHLDAGDKVSVHSAMISQRGAGQPNSIEIKGIGLGFTKEFNFTTIDGTNASEYLPTKYEVLEGNASSQTIEIRDDTLNFNVGYYFNMNGHNYIHLPRRWWYKEETSANRQKQYTDPDELGAGMTEFRAFKDNFFFYDDYYQIIGSSTDLLAGKKFYKPRNNNDRYTLMVRDKTYYSEVSASGNLPNYPNRDPENAIYRQYKEFKSINIPAGFNSPEFVATEITRQLSNITEDRTYEFKGNFQNTGAPDDVEPGFPIRAYKTINTETYKAFNVAHTYKETTTQIQNSPYNGSFGVIEEDFRFYITADGDGNNASGYQWLSQYHLIGCKRPELYETGRLVNRFSIGGDSYRGIFGTPQGSPTGPAYASHLFEISQDYTETNCRRWYEFFKAQELYPEIWNIFSDSRTGYTDGDTIENSRWFHINRFENGSQSYTGDTSNNGNAMLGDSGYINHSWNSDNASQTASAICPIYYNSDDRDIFYENPEENQYSFGCMKKSTFGKIEFQFTDNNTFGSPFMDMLLENAPVSTILRNRKCGFDMHFSAPGMSYALPFAGWDDQVYQFNNAHPYGNFQLASGNAGDDYPLGDYSLNSTLYKNKLYIGADSPKLEWNGTNFLLRDLHTPINITATNVAGTSYVFANINTNVPEDVGQVVYQINPREKFNDWTPARKPYRFTQSSTHAHTDNLQTEELNQNLEAWTIYDALCGIFIEDLNLSENEWVGSLWDLLGFSYRQFHSSNHSRVQRITNNNINSLSVITTSAEVNQGDSKLYVQNPFGVPMYNNMIPGAVQLFQAENDSNVAQGVNYPEINIKTESLKIVADNLPTRMIRGYYTIRSNILEGTPFIGGKVNNTTMPIIGVVDKINGDGDFYFQQESSLEFTITKPLKLASVSCSIHDPDGSYASTSEQNSVLFKIQKPTNVTFNVLQELLQEQQQKK